MSVFPIRIVFGLRGKKSSHLRLCITKSQSQFPEFFLCNNNLFENPFGIGLWRFLLFGFFFFRSWKFLTTQGLCLFAGVLKQSESLKFCTHFRRFQLHQFSYCVFNFHCHPGFTRFPPCVFGGFYSQHCGKSILTQFAAHPETFQFPRSESLLIVTLCSCFFLPPCQ